jgi:hypothetical protein
MKQSPTMPTTDVKAQSKERERLSAAWKAEQEEKERKAALAQRGQCTKAAWEQLVRIDIRLHPLRKSDLVEFMHQTAVLTSEIRIDSVDEELRQLIQDQIGLATKSCDVLSQYRQEIGDLDKTVEQVRQLGGTIGSANRENPQGGAVAGQLIFGALGAAAASEKKKEIQAKYSPDFGAMEKGWVELGTRQEELRGRLSRKYELPFIKPM